MRIVWMTVVVVGWLGLQGVSADELFDIKSADEHFNKGLSLYFQKDYMGAIKEFSESININPENAKAYYFIGYSHYKLGTFSEASEAFKQVYRLDANYSPVHPQPSAPQQSEQGR